ncbi:MAG: low molecular weight phosphatase family protein [Planctomycetes bacterium]|nr:low molecular weight phosphatase family protein [Planctomycetota bacterium]
MPSALFLCRHNACRSQIAEAVCRSLAPAWDVASAGSRPSADVDRKAVEILRRHGLAMASPRPKGVPGLPSRRWDVVVCMGCDGAGAGLPSGRYVEWPVEDPSDGPIEIYEALFRELSERVGGLVREAESPAR